jgi:LmbE family N-acetylglucosaminyl deacetylase
MWRNPSSDGRGVMKAVLFCGGYGTRTAEGDLVPKPLQIDRLRADDDIEEIAPIAKFPIWVNGGYFVLTQEIFDLIPENGDLVGDACMALAGTGRLLGYRHHGFWKSADRFKRARRTGRRLQGGTAPVDGVGAIFNEAFGMIPLTTGGIGSVAAIGAHCDDIVIGAGATLMQIVHHNPEVVVHALVLTGGGTEREIEEKNAFAALFPRAGVRLTVADLPDGRLPDHWGSVKRQIARFRRQCQPDLVIGPQRNDYHQDHRLVAELIPTEFRAHQVLTYEILKWESDLLDPTLYAEIPTEIAHQKAKLPAQSHPSQSDRDWFDDEAFLGLMRVRGVQCRVRYAEAFVGEKAVVSPYGVNSLN